LKEKRKPGTSKTSSGGLLRLQYTNQIAGTANSKAAPAATPPAIAPVWLPSPEIIMQFSLLKQICQNQTHFNTLISSFQHNHHYNNNFHFPITGIVLKETLIF